MESKLNFQLPDGSNELILREGAALPLKEPLKVAHAGILSAPADWFEKKRDTIEPLLGNVVANYTGRWIVLALDENDAYGTTITGKLTIFPELDKLGINAEKQYSEKDLMKQLNFFGRWFVDKDAHKDILFNLQQFKARIEKELTNADDFKGNAAISKITKIEHDIPLQFDLRMPIFSGYPESTFKVTVNVSARDTGAVVFWLESKELYELISIKTDELFEEQLSRLHEFAIVKQW